MISTSTLITPELAQEIHNSISQILQLALLFATTMLAMGIKWWIAHLKVGIQRDVATQAVRFVEQTMVGKDSGEKFMKAATILHSRFPQLSTDELERLIESSVHGITAQLDAAVAPPATVPTTPQPSVSPESIHPPTS